MRSTRNLDYMRILVFTEGTLIMHKCGLGQSREQIVMQSIEGKDSSLYDWKSYIPVGNAVQKLNAWKSQGAQILYLTSRRLSADVETIRGVLRKCGFPEGQLLYRQGNEEYKDVAEKAMPQIIVEDDCESIGGENQMTFTNLKPELKKKIKLITVEEFGGIDHLPDRVDDLVG